MALFDQDVILVMVIIFLIAIAIGLVIGFIIRGKKRVQPITKNQYERLRVDNLQSAKASRLKQIKYVGLTGSKYTRPQSKWGKYVGSNIHPNIIDIWVKKSWLSKKRWLIVPWMLTHNLDGKTIWIDADGFLKDGYFWKPLVPRDVLKSLNKKQEWFDNLVKEHIRILLQWQGTNDMMEQKEYETMVSASHDVRPISEIMIKPEYPTLAEEEGKVEPELE